MKKALISFKLIFLCVSAFAQVQQKKIYEISAAKLDSVNKQIVNVSEDSFRIDLQLPDSVALKKATMYINDKNAQNITFQLEQMLFTIVDFNSITIEIELAGKSFAKAAPLQMLELKHEENGVQKIDTLLLNNLQAFIKENKISSYAVRQVIIPLSNNEVKLGNATRYTIAFINAIDVEGRSLRNSNLIIGALIKTLAGARPSDELIDLFIKLNYGKQKRTFSLFGADAGIGSIKDSNTTGLFRINEAVANFNYAVYSPRPHKTLKRKKDGVTDTKGRKFLTDVQRKTNDSLKKQNTLYIDSTLKRTAFFGGGLKIFNSTPYVGIHFGSIEINGPLFGSYIFTGYYYSPYLQKVTTRDSLQFQNYRNNIYIEAGINAFGSRVPNILKTLKLKFGLMLPIKGGKGDKRDMFRPESKDVLSRLAIEVPLGTVFRF